MGGFSFLPLFILIFVVSNGQQNVPILLTDGNDGQKSLEYVSNDQCMLQPGQEKIRSFGLRFHLPNSYFCESEGSTFHHIVPFRHLAKYCRLLICYPGQLDAKNMFSGMAFTHQYRVNNADYNEVAERCLNKQAEFCAGKSAQWGPCAIPWHGILVRTIEEGKSIQLKMSFSYYNYIFGQIEHFSLNFGREDSLFTAIGMPKTGKYRVFTVDRKMSEEFHKNIGNGARLSQFVGIWMLGLDVLPGIEDEQIHFFVYRSCDCLMDVWEPEEKETILMGNNECPAKEMDFYINLDGLKEDQKIILDILVAENGTKLIVMLANSDKTKWFWGMKMNVTTTIFTDNSTIALGLPQGKKIHLEIIFHRYFQDIAYGDQNTIIQRIWWKKWWNKTMLDSRTEFLYLKGDAKMLKKEKIVQGSSAAMYYLSAPIVHKLNDIVHISQIEFRIRAKSTENANFWEINLLHDAQEWHKFIGFIMLRIRVDFAEDSLTTSSYLKQWVFGNTTKEKNVNPFRAGLVFECRIIVTAKTTEKTNFTIIINVENDERTVTKHIYLNFPIWLLNWIQFLGDIQLLSEPEILNKTTFEGNKTKVYTLPHLFHEGDKICISGKAGTKFAINLQHDSSQFSEIVGDTPLQILIDFDNPDEKLQFQTSTFILIENETDSRNERQEDSISFGHSPIALPGDQFTLAIEAGKTIEGVPGFIIRVNNNDRHQKDQKAIIPLWTTKFVQLVDDIEEMELDLACSVFPPLPRWIKQIDEKKSLSAGKSITIQGTIKMPKIQGRKGNSFSVNFFYQALGWDPKYGQTIFQANFSLFDETMDLNSYLNGSWLINNQNEHKYSLNPPLENGQQFNLKIAITDEEYQIHLDNLGSANPIKYEYKALAVPPWAIDYIVVNGAEDGNDHQVLALTSDIQIV